MKIYNSISGTDGEDASDGISDSGDHEKASPKDFLDSILSHAKPWSSNNKWKKIVSETDVESMYLVSKKSKTT